MKKVLAMILACLMVLSTLPVVAFAADEGDADHEHTCPGAGEQHTTENCCEYTEVSTVESTCGVTGYTVYQCDICGDYFADDFVAAKEHNWVDFDGVDATCEKEGREEGKVCTICKAYNEDAKVIPKLEHVWGDPVPAGDGSTGCMVRECTLCGATEPAEGGHEWSDVPVIVVEPTCGSDGLAVYVCTKCHTEKEVVIKADGNHTLVHHPAVAETCDADGSIEYWSCSECGKLFDSAAATNEITADDVVIAKHHTYEVDNPITVVEPTCTAWGFKLWACTECGDIARVDSFEPLGHIAFEENDPDAVIAITDFGVFTGFDSESVAYSLGWKYNDLDVTNDIVSITVGMKDVYGQLIVEYTADEEQLAYQRENGYITNTGLSSAPFYKDYQGTPISEGRDLDWTVEKGSAFDSMDPDSAYLVVVTDSETYELHRYLNPTQSEVIVEPTCEKDGSKTWTCGRCGEELTEVIPKLGHDLKVEAVAPTCSSFGYTRTYCTRCDYEKKTDFGTTLDPDNHVYDYENVVVTEAATCGKDGKGYVQCEGCGKVVEVVIPMTGEHVYSESTVGDCGTCTECGHVRDHEFTVETGRVGATCAINGSITYKCENCDQTKTVIIPATGHKWVITPEKAPTCAENGYTEKWVCSVCEETHPDHTGEVLDKLEHDWSDIVEQVDPTCTSTGLQSYRQCKLCGAYRHGEVVDYEDLIIPKKPHDYKLADSAVADCEQFGYKHCICSVCGDEYIDSYVAALGHINEDDEIITDDCCDTVTDRECVRCGEEIAKSHNNVVEQKVPATCNNYGYTIEYCANCGKELKVKDVVEPAHQWGAWETVEKAGISDGLRKHTCTVCGEVAYEVIPAIYDVEFELVVDNAVVGGAGYSDSSLVKVTVVLNAESAALWGFNFDIGYDPDVFRFDSYEFLSDKFINTALVNDNKAKECVSVAAYAPNGEDGKTQNVIADGEEAILVLYFTVNTGNKVTDIPNGYTTIKTAFEFDTATVVDKDTKELEVNCVESDIEVLPYLDVNGDNFVNIADILAVYKMVAGESETVYDVRADIDKDGSITVYDFYMIYEYVVGANTYEDMTGLKEETEEPEEDSGSEVETEALAS